MRQRPHARLGLVRATVASGMLAVLALVASPGIAAAAEGHGAVGEPVPEYEARVLGSDEMWSVQDDGSGEVLLLNIWATWCVPCREEIPDLLELQDEYGDDIQVVTISVDDEGFDDKVREFADNLDMDVPILRDEDKTFQRTFRTSGVPETVLVDADGVVAYRWKGPLTFDADLERIVDRAVAGEGDYKEAAVEDASASGIGMLSALLAGLLSFLSPCVLPLVPSYAAFLGASGAGASNRKFLLRGTSFVLGFSAVFISLGIAASLAGGIVLEAVPWIARVGGVLLILLGVATLGLVKLPWFEQERRAMGSAVSRVGSSPGGSFVIGAAFAAGWTPCIGPILAGILTLAAATGDVARGAALLTAYSIGLAIPFLATTFLVARIPSANRRLNRIAPYAQRIAGALLVIVGILLVTDQLTRLSALASEVVPWTFG